MIRINPEHEDPRRAGEHYLDEVPGPIRIGKHTHSDELWVYYRGTVQGRPCEIRIAAIPDAFLCGVPRATESYGYTCVVLVRETRPPATHALRLMLTTLPPARNASIESAQACIISRRCSM